MAKDKEYNYRIIRIEKDSKGKEKKITMKKFFAENDDDAYAYLKKYRSIASKEYTYYFDNNTGHKVIEDDGNINAYESLMDLFDPCWKQLPWWKKAWDEISYIAWRLLFDIPKDIYYAIRDVVYFIKYKQYYRASWSLDMYVLETLAHNLERLIKEKHGISQCFIDKARLELHKDEKDFNLEEYNKTHMSSVDKDEEDLAVKIQNEIYANIIRSIKLYFYYIGVGVSNDPTFDKMCNNNPNLAIPYIQGTYKNIDYKKLHMLEIKYWNKIWEQIRTYGQTFWD